LIARLRRTDPLVPRDRPLQGRIHRLQSSPYLRRPRYFGPRHIVEGFTWACSITLNLHRLGVLLPGDQHGLLVGREGTHPPIAWSLHGELFYLAIRRWVYGMKTPDDLGPIIRAAVVRFLEGAPAAMCDLRKAHLASELPQRRRLNHAFNRGAGACTSFTLLPARSIHSRAGRA
jgi:hypothetical protein